MDPEDDDFDYDWAAFLLCIKDVWSDAPCDEVREAAQTQKTSSSKPWPTGSIPGWITN